jgi:hypothetical protein
MRKPRGPSRSSRSSRSSHSSRSLDALAYADAVRDILAADGTFHLYDRERGDAVWQWDGVRWTRTELIKRLINSADDAGADEDQAFAELEAEDDLAVAS